ncbi:MAG: peroxiredoxin [Sphingopyxis sp. 65-8]|jgi:peroxiredoxin Q/BCP|uniref:peroxiredoxin n=1 Tax=Sphingopyxis TaxID=165697 RepID=UPI0007379BC4|nr:MULTISPECIES: peroxiredoxin [Sphingopyxis]OJW24171.1 MAG: peroxiredoxin [Sphingopyxis sp. 65-8]KTE75079.1 alkyl hydroperoxide reductase [Sphingopyxis sp. A083]MBN8805168.1 peroxiredoxin [Sphingopyxis terrae]MBU7587818.1 peroxiredoxin [Sphingopyxis terrae]MDX8355994.1 peroxiredoxin [Sphingopyxis terrae]
MSALAIGDDIPAGTLADADGAAIDLKALKGAPLVVYFYPKADTPGCTTEAQDFTRLAPDFAHLNAQVIAVSRDAPAKLCKFRDKYGLTVRLASDEDGSVCEAFGTWVEKQNYGRTYMGIERSTFLFGADGKLAREWRKVRVKGHADAVLEAAKTL